MPPLKGIGQREHGIELREVMAMELMGHVVKKGRLGNTAYQICDDFYRDRTKAALDQAARNFNEIGKRILINAERRSGNASDF